MKRLLPLSFYLILKHPSKNLSSIHDLDHSMSDCDCHGRKIIGNACCSWRTLILHDPLLVLFPVPSMELEKFFYGGYILPLPTLPLEYGGVVEFVYLSSNIQSSIVAPKEI